MDGLSFNKITSERSYFVCINYKGNTILDTGDNEIALNIQMAVELKEYVVNSTTR